MKGPVFLTLKEVYLFERIRKPMRQGSYPFSFV